MLAVTLNSKIKVLLNLKLYVHFYASGEEKRKAKEESELSSVRIHLGPDIFVETVQKYTFGFLVFFFSFSCNTSSCKAVTFLTLLLIN